ncbi:RNA polymerase sigma factor [Caloranaerobacter azorensis]|uniref:Sigma-70 family RNA polymerase sigma factor n=1 Tax=Caloranaerobacter azorensis TaxID=116090 RepID=A0A6P1YI25_9FIRM|nr:sigma-70 family RNA polymerase sigma factor [Caloranaerobacter azorensis]QIB27526.1 sigma-70 family RNA polymerase sigma factor [Caloranaerobacter azorensis]
MYSEINKLIDAAKNGDMTAKEKLLFKLKPVVLSSIRRYFNRRDLYEDLIQEGYEIILRALRYYDEDKGVHFLGYVKMMLKFHYLNNSRKNREYISLNQTINSKDDSLELIDCIADENLLQDEIVIKNEEVLDLMNALDELTERQREIVFMYYIQNISLKEISKRLDISYRTAVNIKTSAIKKLRKSIVNL